MRTRIERALKDNEIDLAQEVIEKFEKIYKITIKWSQKINITGNVSEDSFLRENILDPVISCIKVESEGLLGNGRISDVGCGGGFAGIAWNLVSNNKSHIYLIDSDRKKINFCRQIIRETKLSDIETINNRVENVDNLDCGIVMTRATWAEGIAVEKCTKLCASKGKILLFRGVNNEKTGSGVKNLQYIIEPWGRKREIQIHPMQ